MKLKVLASGSRANSYLLHSGKEVLIIEAGLSLKTIKKSLNFDLSGIAGCLVSHSHNDHAGYVRDYVNAGITVIACDQVFISHDISLQNPSVKVIGSKGFKAGSFKILPFPVCHDVPCFGFLIDHPESGRILFMTDTFMCEYTFPGVNHMMIEANYCDEILERNISNGIVHPCMRPRLLKTHMELKTCKGIFKAADLSEVRNIILIHLSSDNSDEEMFVREVREETGRPVYAAHKGLEIDINLIPY